MKPNWPRILEAFGWVVAIGFLAAVVWIDHVGLDKFCAR